MEINGVYDFTVSGIDGNGFQYIDGMLEPERLNERGVRIGKAFTIQLYHNQQKTQIFTFDWVNGAPKNHNLVAELKGEIIAEIEVPGLLKKYNIL